MNSPIVGFVLIIAMILLARIITVILHEVGHAITFMILTRQKVTIYIGSYGNPNKSSKIKVGYLEIYFRNNPFYWLIGLCRPSAESISYNRQIFCIIAGPFSSLICAIISSLFIFNFEANGFIKLFMVLFIGSSCLDILSNLIPNDTPIKTYNGEIVFNDGYSLKLILQDKKLPKEFTEALELFNDKKFLESSLLCDNLIDNGYKNENLFRIAIYSYIQIRKFERAKILSDKFYVYDKMNSDDYSSMALVYAQLGHYEKSMEYFNRSLNQDPDNFHSLNNMGYTLNLMNRYKEAISMFDRAISLDPKFAYAYNNRGLSKIKLGQIEEGLKDIHDSIEIDCNNSYSYKNLGIYHFEKAEYSIAFELFSKAKSLDNTTHEIDYYINLAQNKLSMECR